MNPKKDSRNDDAISFSDSLKDIAKDFADIEGVGTLVQEMVQNAADIEAIGAEIEKALASGQEDLAMELIQKQSAAIMATLPPEYEPEVYPAPYGALHAAIEDGDLLETDRLIKAGVDLNGFTDKYGGRPLIWAMQTENRSPEMIGVLIAGGADAAYTTDEGYNALHYIADACFRDDHVDIPTEIARVLVENGCDIEARTHWGWTPLYRAIFEGTSMEAEALLRNGADANSPPVETEAPECAKTQPLLLAAGMDTEKVRLLLEHGADASAVLGAFQAAAINAEKARVDRRASGDNDPFYDEYAEGYAASLKLIQAASNRSLQ